MNKDVTPGQAARIIKKQIKTPKDLPKPIQKAAVKGLRNIDMSIRQIARITGLATDTVMDYIDATIDDEYLRYQDAIQKIVVEQNDTLAIMTGNIIRNKLQDSDSVPFRDAITAYKVMHEVRNPKHSQTNSTSLVQVVNVHPALGREKKAYNSIDGEVVDSKK